MECYARAGRVAVPLCDVARTRLIGRALDYTSSGSDHDPADDSPCLSELVHGFLEDNRADGWDSIPELRSHDDAEGCDEGNDLDTAKEIIASAMSTDNRDAFQIKLSACVRDAARLYSSCWLSNKSLMWRQVMSFLRDSGYNATVCKTEWSSSGGLTAGDYEFIDVVRSDRRQLRYFVDLDLRGVFEIARQTDDYSELLDLIPRVFVGRGDDLKQIVRCMCDAGRRSLKSRGLSVPPWRKNRYMQNKWMGPYRRTTNPYSAATGVIAPAMSVGRWVRRGGC